VLSYIREVEGTPCIRSPSDGELLSLCRGPSPFLSLPLLLPFTFIHSSGKTNPPQRASTVFFHPIKVATKCLCQGPAARPIRMPPRALSRRLRRGARLLADNAEPQFALSNLSSLRSACLFASCMPPDQILISLFSLSITVLPGIRWYVWPFLSAANPPPPRDYSISPKMLSCSLSRREGSIDSGRVSAFSGFLRLVPLHELTTGSSLLLLSPCPSRINVRYDRPSIQLMTSGAYTIQEVICLVCTSYLGWKMIRAHERSERWKEGKHILELEFVQELLPPPVQRGTLPEIETARRKRMRRAASIWGSRDTNYSLPFAPQMPEFTSPTWTPLVGGFA